MLEKVEKSRKDKIKENFYNVANSKNGLYVLIDYVNFKGEGTSQKERYNGEGWGLLQVLEYMDENEKDYIKAFADSAVKVLAKRVGNSISV